MPLDPMNPTAIAHDQVRVADAMDAATDRFAIAARESALADAAFKRAWAVAMVEIIADSAKKMTVQHREAVCEITTNGDRVAAGIADAVMRSAREALHTLRNQSEMLRTLSASVRNQS